MNYSYKELKKMARSLILLKFNMEKFPTDSNEIRKILSPMLTMTEKDLQEGKLKDWGYFVGANGAYAVSEQSAEEIAQVAMQMQPYVTFEVHQVLTANQVGQVVKSLRP
jgi:hypothetical protein